MVDFEPAAAATFRVNRIAVGRFPAPERQNTRFMVRVDQIAKIDSAGFCLSKSSNHFSDERLWVAPVRDEKRRKERDEGEAALAPSAIHPDVIPILKKACSPADIMAAHRLVDSSPNADRTISRKPKVPVANRLPIVLEGVIGKP